RSAQRTEGGVAALCAQRIESPEPRLQRPARERRRVVAADESVMGEGLTVALTASYIEVGAEGARARARRVDGDGIGCAGWPRSLGVFRHHLGGVARAAGTVGGI